MKKRYRDILQDIAETQQPDPKTRSLCFVATASSLNNMAAAESVIRFTLRQERASYAELYEAVLQTYLFAGFPAALEGLSVLYKCMPNNTIGSFPMPYSLEEYRHRGEQLCQSIYTNVYEKMRAKLGRISPDLDHWMIIEGYGKTLSRPGISTKTRELISACSLAAMGWENQCYSHIRGALNVGASPAECRGLLPIVKSLVSQHRYKNAVRIFDIVLEGSLS